MIPNWLSSRLILNEKMEDCALFPMLYEEMRDLVPEVYFGGADVPAYLPIELDSTSSLEDIVSTIRSMVSGANSSG